MAETQYAGFLDTQDINFVQDLPLELSIHSGGQSGHDNVLDAAGGQTLETVIGALSYSDAQWKRIRKEGKFPLILNLGQGHFVSVVLYRKPNTEGVSTNHNPWKIAVTDSVDFQRKDSYVTHNIVIPYSEMETLLAGITAAQNTDAVKKNLGEIDTSEIHFKPCVKQEGNNCLLNTYINCRDAHVNSNGQISFPGTDDHNKIKRANIVEKEAQVLRQYANLYGGYQDGDSPGDGSIKWSSGQRDRIQEMYQKFEDTRKNDPNNETVLDDESKNIGDLRDGLMKEMKRYENVIVQQGGEAKKRYLPIGSTIYQDHKIRYGSLNPKYFYIQPPNCNAYDEYQVCAGDDQFRCTVIKNAVKEKEKEKADKKAEKKRKANNKKAEAEAAKKEKADKKAAAEAAKKEKEKEKFTNVLKALSTINKTKWKLTQEEIATIFNDAEAVDPGQNIAKHGGYTTRGLPGANEKKRKAKRKFSITFQKLCKTAGLLTLNTSKGVKQDTGMRTKWVNTFCRKNAIKLIQEGGTGLLQQTGFKQQEKDYNKGV